MSILQKYAHLLVNYCLEIKEGDKFYIRTTTLAEPLVKELYIAALKAGAYQIETDMGFSSKGKLFYEHASEAQLRQEPFLQKQAMETFDAYLYLRAPFNLRADQNNDPEKVKLHQEATKGISNIYFKRTATRDLKRSLCQYPTEASAQAAGMSLDEYSDFVFGACNLFAEDPQAEWKKLSASQQVIVDHLNGCQDIQYKGDGIDIKFSTKGRTWINSDGQTNMPSGEVYTSPVENSVQGQIHFSYPGAYFGKEVEGVTLWVKDGYIEKWEARRGGDFLDEIFAMDGTRRFGEAAIDTNYNIQQMTNNILFDEKIGGTVHMAIGQSYLQCGGKNESSVHWDMITEMKNGGQIFADDELIYENGIFLM